MVWGDDGTESAPLLDWLGVTHRHYQDSPEVALSGMVLLDLPDVLVWVLDPQKYADASVHDRYLRPYVQHAGVLLVVLNQI